MQIPNNWLTFLDLPISGSMFKKEHTDIVTSYILSSPAMMTIWLRVCLCLLCCLIISLLTFMYPNQNNLLQQKWFHIENISRLFSLVLDPPDDVDHLVDLYNSTLRDIVDEHAPLRTKDMPRKPMLPWYNKSIQVAKRHRRYCEWLWIRTTLCVHHKMFKVSKSLVKNTLAFAKYE